MLKKYASIAQMQQEGTKQDRFLFSYRDNVYDLTPFVDEHPGGRFSLSTFKGKDLENIIFNASIHRHQQQILSTLEHYRCGIIEAKKTNQLKAANSQPSKTSQKKELKPKSKSKGQIQDDKTNKSFQTTNQSVISIGKHMAPLQSPDSKSKDTQQVQQFSSKVISTAESQIAIPKSALKKSQQIPETPPTPSPQQKTTSSAIETHVKQKLQRPSVIQEEEESQISQQQFDVGLIPDELLNLQIPILDYKMSGYVRKQFKTL